MCDASNGGQMSNSQLIGSLEIAKLNIHRMLATEAERKQSSNILKVAPLVSPGISG